MGLTTQTATDLSGLTSVDFPSLVGDMYAKWTLDCLTEIGYAVSVDFIARPQLFTGNIPAEIVFLRMSYGNSAPFPNNRQRAAMMMPIFGRSDGLKPDAGYSSAPFYLARKQLLDGCIAFSERAVSTGMMSMLEERVRSAVISLRAYFEALRGTSFAQSAKQMEGISTVIVQILNSPGISRVYSVPPAGPDWPLASEDPTVNATGAKLVEAIGTALALAPDYQLSYIKFILLQRVAQEGGRTLPQIFTANVNNDHDLQSLISQGYIWATSLRDFQQTP
ncbi:hypothetical protein [Caballeronia mineralivorans]|uniref:hypothetical protein n=1 Tax=Caballeronia mineralivorans TaxID=2010198 RepID=UPI0023EFAEF4|nr:hypothetical protein [Caballeronia mineralivorans]MDB5784905.1 hypothetical protein [Caballeronia mineralivorans]